MKPRNNISSIICLVLATLGSNLALRAVILPVAEDTSSTIAGKINPTTGKATTLSVTAKEHAFLTFDLSTLPATVTATNITSARLNLYVSSLVAPGDLTVHMVTNEWRENTTNIAAPGYSAEVVGTIPAADLVAKTFVEVDVTAAVSNWFNGASNFGFAIATASGNVRLASKEGLGTGFPELLEIEPGVNVALLNVSQLTNGTVPLASLPGAVVTNNETDVNLGGAFSGNGAGLTNLNLAASPPGAINENSITIGPTNIIASLTVPPATPASAIGGTGGGAKSVAVAGRYAYVVTLSSALQVFDVSNPSAPGTVGSIGTDASPTSVAVAGRYAYVVSGASTLHIYDVGNPAAPSSVGSIGTDGGPTSVAVAGRYAYVVSGASTLHIYDIGNPAAPSSVGSIGTDGGPKCVAVAGHYAYVVSGASTLHIYDVGNPASPSSVGSVGTDGNAQGVAVAGRYAYVATGASTLQIFDVSNPASPSGTGSIGTGGNAQGVAVAGRYAYVVSGASLLQIFDVSDPTAPSGAGSVGTGGNAVGVAVAGRYAYVVSGGSTLQIFDLGGAYIQQLEAGAMETGTLQTRDTVTVGNHLNVRGGFTAGGNALVSGALSVSGIGSPTYTLYANGVVAGVGAYVNASDARYKTNIARLTHALDKIMALRGVEYDWRSNAFPQLNFDNGKQLGFVAQEIKEVLPEVVSQDARGYYSIAYSKVIPVLVEAIKDQQREMTDKNTEIETLKEKADKVDLLQKRLDELEAAVKTLAEKK